MPGDARQETSEPTLARWALPAVALSAGVAYALTAARGVLGGDTGELAAVGAHGGVAHPPGYPLYVLWLRLWSWLPAESPAHRAALATAMLGALGVLLVGTAARAWGASRAAATLAAAAFAFAPLAWKLATEPEVFALNVVLAMAIVIAASPRLAPPRGSEALRVGLLGLLAGLGLSNHHSVVLLAPVGLFAAVRGVTRSGGAAGRARAVALGLGGLALGLSPYLYLVVVARSTPLGEGCVWGDPRDLAGLLRHFLRAEYGTTQLAVGDAPTEPLVQLALLAERLLIELSALPALAVFGAVAALHGGRPKLRDAAPLIALVLAFVLAGPAFVSRFNLPPRGLGALVVARFHLLPMALASVLAALALDALVAATPQHVRARAASVVLALALSLAGARAALTLPDVREDHRPTTDLYVRNVLAIAPKDAILVGSGDDRIGGFLYARCALRARPDVQFLSAHLLLTDWYPRQVSARLGLDVVRGERGPGDEHPTLDGAALMAQLVSTGRPVFVTDWFARGLDRSIPSYPWGPLVRVVPSWKQIPAPDALYAENEAVFDRLVVEPSPPAAGTWAGVRARDYARPWLVLADAFERAGDVEKAGAARARARALAPPP